MALIAGDKSPAYQLYPDTKPLYERFAKYILNIRRTAYSCLW